MFISGKKNSSFQQIEGEPPPKKKTRHTGEERGGAAPRPLAGPPQSCPPPPSRCWPPRRSVPRSGSAPHRGRPPGARGPTGHIWKHPAATQVQSELARYVWIVVVFFRVSHYKWLSRTAKEWAVRFQIPSKLSTACGANGCKWRSNPNKH